MARSARLRLQDLRAIQRIVGECRELGDSAMGWRLHLLDAAARLSDGGIGVEYEVLWGPRYEIAPLVRLGAADWGWRAGYDHAAYEALNREFMARGESYSPMYPAYVEILNRGTARCLTRADVVPDSSWYRSAYYRDHHSPTGGDAKMYSMSPMHRAGFKSMLVLVRPAGEPDFAPRARAIVAELHSQIAPLIEAPLAGYQEPSPDDLAPRARQVLRCLLEGEGDKQVAARLGLSRHTVNFYVRQIFVHFGVSTRSELMSRWIRRGWGLSSMPRDEGV